MKTYTRMVIGECNSAEQLTELQRIYGDWSRQYDLRAEPGFCDARFMAEEDGRMFVLTTTWLSRDTSTRFHASKSYRLFVATTQHLLIGDFVVKLFEGNTELDEHPDPCLVAVGTAFSGINLFGPFASTEEATSWAEQNTTDEWNVVDLTVIHQDKRNVGGTFFSPGNNTISRGIQGGAQ